MTVAVVEKAAFESTFNTDDVKIDWFSGTGCGGQNRNKVQNSCRALHVPTGISAKAETRSRSNSLNAALEELKKRVDSAGQASDGSAKAADRKQQVGSGMRGDKIRTYRLQDDTVTDHRSERRSTWREIERGDFSKLK